ncbi:hypothetical protein OIU79_027813 [Salix purpurea]|uniref:Uncharacterized protein n=1 Tax=Salix purpurea TaxID=77065 RepID=A0A9Q1A299_SALPP|nr:hypothetical protein OIU79_027813 [Salix purpurea]
MRPQQLKEQGGAKKRKGFSTGLLGVCKRKTSSTRLTPSSRKWRGRAAVAPPVAARTLLLSPRRRRVADLVDCLPRMIKFVCENFICLHLMILELLSCMFLSLQHCYLLFLVSFFSMSKNYEFLLSHLTDPLKHFMY